MEMKNGKIILVGSPDIDTWAATHDIYEPGDKVVPYGKNAAGLPLGMEIHMPRMHVVPDEHGPLMIHGTLELRAEIERIKQSLGPRIVTIRGEGLGANGTYLFRPANMPTPVMNALAVVGILTQQGIWQLAGIPGTLAVRKELEALKSIVPSIRRGLTLEVYPIPQETER